MTKTETLVSAVRSLVSKTQKLTNYSSFSKILVGLADDDEDLVSLYGGELNGRDVRGALSDLLYSGGYQKGLKVWTDAVAPNGLPLTRGLYGLVIPDRWSAQTYYRASRKDKNFFSLNAAYVGANFAAPATMDIDLRFYTPPKESPSLKDLTKDAGRWTRNVWMNTAADMARTSGQRGLKAIRAAALAIQSSMLIAYRASPPDVFSFGGDSESGLMMEAEMYVKRCDECLDGVFVLSAAELDAPLASDAERKRFGLSWWNAVIYEDPSMTRTKKRLIYIAPDAGLPRRTQSVVEVREPRDHVYHLFPADLFGGQHVKKIGSPLFPSATQIARDWRWYKVV